MTRVGNIRFSPEAMAQILHFPEGYEILGSRERTHGVDLIVKSPVFDDVPEGVEAMYDLAFRDEVLMGPHETLYHKTTIVGSTRYR